jgi:hypothetical protein
MQVAFFATLLAFFAPLRYTSGVLCGGDAMRSKANLGVYLGVA